MFVCKRCGYTTKVKQHMQNHNARKTPCKSKQSAASGNKKTFTCEFCTRVVNRKDNLLRHQRTCAAANSTVTFTKQQFKELLDKFQPTNTFIDNSTTNNNCVNVNNNLNINFNDLDRFLKCDRKILDEFYRHIPPTRMIEYVWEQDPNRTHIRLVEDVFFNEKRKENMTLAVTDIEKNEASIFYEGKWNKADASVVVNDIILINATEVADANSRLPSDAKRESYELHTLFDNKKYTEQIMKFAHEKLGLIESVHGKIF